MKKIFFSLLAIFFGSAYKANLPFFLRLFIPSVISITVLPSQRLVLKVLDNNDARKAKK